MGTRHHDQTDPGGAWDSGHTDPTAKSDCSALLALIPAYSIGATDPDETHWVEMMLPNCPDAAAELPDYLALSEALLYVIPDAQARRSTSTHPAAPLAQNTSRRVTKTAPPAPVQRPNRDRVYVWVNRVALLIAAAALLITNFYWLQRNAELQMQQQIALAIAQQAQQRAQQQA